MEKNIFIGKGKENEVNENVLKKKRTVRIKVSDILTEEWVKGLFYNKTLDTIIRERQINNKIK